MVEMQRTRLKLDILYLARDYAKERNADNAGSLDAVLGYAEKFYNFVTKESE